MSHSWHFLVIKCNMITGMSVMERYLGNCHWIIMRNIYVKHYQRSLYGQKSEICICSIVTLIMIGRCYVLAF